MIFQIESAVQLQSLILQTFKKTHNFHHLLLLVILFFLDYGRFFQQEMLKFFLDFFKCHKWNFGMQNINLRQRQKFFIFLTLIGGRQYLQDLSISKSKISLISYLYFTFENFIHGFWKFFFCFFEIWFIIIIIIIFS